MLSVIPEAAQPLLACLAMAFTEPTFQRFLTLLVAAILTPGRRTVTQLLWTARSLTQGHFSSYHRVLSQRRWSLWPLGQALATAVLACVPRGQPVVVAIDDHAILHKGKKVYGKARHRDAIRSSHAHLAWLYGHRWVVLCVCVKMPWSRRPWALPVLAALCRDQATNTKEGHGHRTAPRLARSLMAALLHWFPQRKFIFLGDGGFASHDLARFCRRHHPRATFISRLHARACLYKPPPKKRKGPGRPRVKGAKLPSPARQAAASKPLAARVGWYGGGRRRVGLVSALGSWYRGGQGLVELRWVYVEDRQGTHRPEYFFCTDPSLSPARIVSLYTTRWAIEVTFQEARAHLGTASTRNRSRNSVLRSFPCLLGLFSLVSLIYLKAQRPALRRVPAYPKAQPTFADALAAVRGLFWRRMLLETPGPNTDVSKSQRQVIDTLLECVCYAA